MPDGTQIELRQSKSARDQAFDVVLIATKSDYLEFADGFIEWPQGLLSIAGPCLDAGYSVKILDQRVDRDWRKELAKLLNRRPIVVGMSSMSGPHLRNTVEVARWIKGNYPGQPIVIGGPHATMAPVALAESGLFEAVATSEGEEVFLEIIEKLRSDTPLGDICGIYFKDDDGQIIQTPPRDVIDVNLLKPLPYHLIDANRYNPNVGGNRSIAFFPDRGCPHRCAFCNVNDYYFTNKARMMSAEALVRHMREIKENVGVEVIAMGDSNFLGNVHRIQELVELLEKDPVGLNIKCSGRVDDILRIVDRLGVDMLRRMRNAGFIAFQVGIESGSDHLLEYMDKKLSVAEVRRCNTVMKETEIIPLYSFMAGVPHETLEDGQKTLELMIEIAEGNPNARMTSLTLFRLLPGATKFWQIAQFEYGVKAPTRLEDWFDLFAIGHPWLTDRELKMFKKWDLMSYFVSPQTICEYYPKWWAKILAPIYGAIVKWRIRHKFYTFMPEIYVLDRVRGTTGMSTETRIRFFVQDVLKKVRRLAFGNAQTDLSRVAKSSLVSDSTLCQ